ncbi:MAG TPA: mechanosensitive ion channel family protein [Castellaniella sp.]|nr:mechanosensitive ion channel family protein [Castellaniella sp.]
MDDLNQYIDAMPELNLLLIHGLVTLVILVVGWMLSTLAGHGVRRLAARSSRIDPTVVPILRSVAVWTIRIVVLLAVLARLGIQTASLIAVLGAAGLALGLALQGTLQNIAAGIMLLILRPIRAGEYVSVVGQGDGTVDEVGLFMTRLIQFDGVHVLLPNGSIWGNPVINYSRNATRRLDVAIGVRYDDDIDQALRVLQSLIESHADVLPDPAPQAMATEYRDSGVMLNMRVWTPAGRYWDLRFDLYREATQALQRAGLKTPIPLREVRAVAGTDAGARTGAGAVTATGAAAGAAQGAGIDSIRTAGN